MPKLIVNTHSDMLMQLMQNTLGLDLTPAPACVQ